MSTKALALCVNVGCGPSAGPSWINLDASPSLRVFRLPLVGRSLTWAMGAPVWPASARYADIVRRPPAPPESCKLIFASHVLEHLPLRDFELAVAHLYECLQPGGVLRCIVPDMEIYARRYLESLRSPDPAVTAGACATFLKDSRLGSAGSRRTFGRRLYEAVSNARHQWMWDRPSLVTALGRSGFSDIAFKTYGDWADERFREIEDPARHDDAICVEAQKTGEPPGSEAR